MIMQQEQVVLVNERDEVLGSMEKLEAHRTGSLHRAFSVFLFDEDGRLLLQKRAMNKYHSAGLWTNTCCSHPRPGEELLAAASRRLKEEMGIDVPLVRRFAFTYKADVGGGLMEHEYDHVFFGSWSGTALPNLDEVSECKFIEPELLEADLERNPQHYTVWLRDCWPLVRSAVAETISSDRT